MPVAMTAVKGRNGLQESRLETQHRKPKMILTDKIPVSSKMELGEKGQLEALLLADGGRLEMDESGTEIKIINFKIISLDRISVNEQRA